MGDLELGHPPEVWTMSELFRMSFCKDASKWLLDTCGDTPIPFAAAFGMTRIYRPDWFDYACHRYGIRRWGNLCRTSRREVGQGALRFVPRPEQRAFSLHSPFRTDGSGESYT